MTRSDADLCDRDSNDATTHCAIHTGRMYTTLCFITKSPIHLQRLALINTLAESSIQRLALKNNNITRNYFGKLLDEQTRNNIREFAQTQHDSRNRQMRRPPAYIPKHGRTALIIAACSNH